MSRKYKTVPETSLKNMRRIVEAQKKAHITEGTPSYAIRVDRINRCIALISDNQEEILDALQADFGNRSRTSSLFSDVVASINTLKHSRRKMRGWMRKSKRSVAFPFNLLGAQAYVKYQPLGCVGNCVPWNFPFSLAFAPLASIFAAGNRCVLKPSEFTPNCSMLLKRLVEQYFDQTELAVVTGGPKTGAGFSALPFDHLLFTGATNIAPHIMRGAAENIVPVTLELGGKSPVLISDTAPMKQAVDRIMFGKTMNAGQICLAPDYIMLPSGKVDEFVSLAQDSVAEMFPTLKDNPDYTSTINERHFTRLNGYLRDAKTKGAEIVEINPAAESFNQQEHYKIPPTLLLNVDDSMKVMKEEIFGPLLPIKTYDTIDDAIDYVNDHDRPLALYYFGHDRAEEKRVLNETVSGGVTVNDVLSHVMQDDLPFGGVGPSGSGAYHGLEGFRNFSHAKSVYRQTRVEKLMAMMRPPFSEKLHNMIKGMAK